MMYGLRIPFLVAFIACAARLLLDLPTRGVYLIGASLASLIVGYRIFRWFAGRRILRELRKDPPRGEDFEFCDARRPVDGCPDLFFCCHKAKHGPETKHEGDLRGGSIEWSGSA